MERQEALAAERAALDARRETAAAERAALAAALAEREGELDAALGGVASTRAGCAAALAPAVVQRYERLRAAPPYRGVAAARVAEGTCLGCRATLPTAFVQTLEDQPAGAVVACPRCGRLLVLDAGAVA